MHLDLDVPQPIEKLRKVYNDKAIFITTTKSYPLISAIEFNGDYLSIMRKRSVPIKIGKKLDRIIESYKGNLLSIWKQHHTEIVNSLHPDSVKKFMKANDDAPDTLAEVNRESDPDRRQVLYMKYLRAQKDKLIKPKIDQMNEALKAAATTAFASAYILGKNRGQALTNQEVDDAVTPVDQEVLNDKLAWNDEYIDKLSDDAYEQYSEMLADEGLSDEDLTQKLGDAQNSDLGRLGMFAAAAGSILLAAGMSQSIKDVQGVDENGDPTGEPIIDEETGLPIGDVVEGGIWHTVHDDRVCDGCEANDDQWMTTDDFANEAGSNECLTNCRCIELFEPSEQPPDEGDSTKVTKAEPIEAKTIAVDLDGTILEKPEYNDKRFGKVLPGAKEALIELKNRGYTIIVHTCRGDTAAIETYLGDHEIPFTAINHNPNQPEDANQGKPLASYYIDDRAVAFTGDWESVLAEIDRREAQKINKGEWTEELHPRDAGGRFGETATYAAGGGGTAGIAWRREKEIVDRKTLSLVRTQVNDTMTVIKDKLPSQIADKIKTVEVTNQFTSAKFRGGSIAAEMYEAGIKPDEENAKLTFAFSDPKSGKLIINANADWSKAPSLETVLLHEAGHFGAGRTDMTKEPGASLLRHAVDEPVEKVLIKGEQGGPVELLAGLFRAYIESPGKMRQTTPQTYSWYKTNIFHGKEYVKKSEASSSSLEIHVLSNGTHIYSFPGLKIEKADWTEESHPRDDRGKFSAVLVYHGTVESNVKSILQTGLKVGKYHVFDQEAQVGPGREAKLREGKVFVTRYSAHAQTYAEMAVAFSDEKDATPVVIEARIPKDYFKKNAQRDTEDPDQSYMLDHIKAEWITAVHKEDDSITVYIPATKAAYEKITGEVSKAEWSEDLHPRDNHGQFSDSGSVAESEGIRFDPSEYTIPLPKDKSNVHELTPAEWSSYKNELYLTEGLTAVTRAIVYRSFKLKEGENQKVVKTMWSDMTKEFTESLHPRDEKGRFGESKSESEGQNHGKYDPKNPPKVYEKNPESVLSTIRTADGSVYYVRGASTHAQAINELEDKGIISANDVVDGGFLFPKEGVYVEEHKGGAESGSGDAPKIGERARIVAAARARVEAKRKERLNEQSDHSQN